MPQNQAKLAPSVGFNNRIAIGFEPIARQNGTTSHQGLVIKVNLVKQSSSTFHLSSFLL
jgi:hypothetical protein